MNFDFNLKSPTTLAHQNGEHMYTDVRFMSIYGKTNTIL